MSGSGKVEQTGPPAGGRFLEIEAMEERTLLAASPIRIGSLGDSLTDEYQFYAPYRTAAQNWPEILCGCVPRRSASATFRQRRAVKPAIKVMPRTRWQRRRHATGDDIVNAGTTFINQYKGGDPVGALVC